MAVPAYIPRVEMRAFPSSSLSAPSSDGGVEVQTTVEYELRIRRFHWWVAQAGGRQRVVAVTAAGDPSLVEVRTFRPSCPSVYSHFMPLYPFNLLASFGIAEDDISLSQELRQDMFCFAYNAAHRAKLARNDRLKIVFTMSFCYAVAMAPAPSPPPSPPPPPAEDDDADADLERAVRESWELEEENRNTRRRRRRRSSDDDEEEVAASTIKKLKKVKYGSSSSSSRYCFCDCRICLEEFLKEEEVSVMPCGHAFHSLCILRWLTAADSCPTCRFQIS